MIPIVAHSERNISTQENNLMAASAQEMAVGCCFFFLLAIRLGLDVLFDVLLCCVALVDLVRV